MVEVWLPYGKTEVAVSVPDSQLLGVIDGGYKKGVANPFYEVTRAIENPIGGKPLDEIVNPGDKIAIVIDDNTRPSPSHLMVKSLLKYLALLDVDWRNITVIVGCGMHTMRIEDVPDLIGVECLEKCNVVIHDHRTKDLEYIGKTSFGTEIYLNKFFVHADVRILTGDIGLHYFAGYGGGRKSVLPAVCGSETIMQNHRLILDSAARIGMLEENPVHMDMDEAASIADVDFIVNVVLNSKDEVVKAFAGDSKKAFFEGIKLVDDIYKVPFSDRAEIVIASPGGHPKDLNLYQAYKGIHSALNLVKEKGVIILVAECPEGHGSRVFCDWMTNFKTLKRVEREIKRNFVIGGHKAYYLSNALKRVDIILVSILPDYYTKGVFRLRSDKTVNSALRSAFKISGDKSDVLIMPHASVTLPIMK